MPEAQTKSDENPQTIKGNEELRIEFPDFDSPEYKRRLEEQNREYQELADSILIDSLKC